MERDYTINSVQNAMQILRLFTLDKREWTLSEIAREKNMSISTCKRLLHTLDKYGYLTRDNDSKKYKLGLSILSLSGIVTTTMEIHREAQPILTKLLHDYGERL